MDKQDFIDGIKRSLNGGQPDGHLLIAGQYDGEPRMAVLINMDNQKVWNALAGTIVGGVDYVYMANIYEPMMDMPTDCCVCYMWDRLRGDELTLYPFMAGMLFEPVNVGTMYKEMELHVAQIKQNAARY